MIGDKEVMVFVISGVIMILAIEFNKWNCKREKPIFAFLYEEVV